MSIVKICGLKEVEHIQKSATWGADLLRMVFVEGARRTIPINQAVLMKKRISNKQIPQVEVSFIVKRSRKVV